MILFVVTGYSRDADRGRTSGAGFDRHFVKPVSHTELLAALDEALAERVVDVAAEEGWEGRSAAGR